MEIISVIEVKNWKEEIDHCIEEIFFPFYFYRYRRKNRGPKCKWGVYNGLRLFSIWNWWAFVFNKVYNMPNNYLLGTYFICLFNWLLHTWPLLFTRLVKFWVMIMKFYSLGCKILIPHSLGWILQLT